MQEQNRVIRAYSEDTERPYYQIRYRLSLTGRELLADALGGSGLIPPPEGRAARSESVSTTISAFDGNPGQDRFIVPEPMFEDEEHKVTSGRIYRSKSLESPADNPNIAEIDALSSQMPGTPRSNFRKSQQKPFYDATFDSVYNNEDQMDMSDESFSNLTELRRSKSVGTATEMQLNRGAPAVPVGSLYNAKEHLKDLEEIYPQFASEFTGLITCLNSKNIRKYKIGQSYRKGIIIGIDEEQGKIIVFQKNMPVGTLIVLKTESPARYEKGFSVQDVQGRTIGTVHAIDKAQHILVVNTSSADINSLYHIQY